MASRFAWKGHLRLSLVSIPVKSYTAVNACSSHGVSLNQLHEKCHSRIKYVKTCPVHGAVSPDEIVSGYEYTKGQYVVIDPDELEKLRTEADRSISVQSVVPAAAVDPLYLGGKTSYLVPDGNVGQAAYQLVQQALGEGAMIAVAQVVMNGKEETVLLRASGRLIAMTTVNYAEEVTEPSAYEGELTEAKWSAAEMKMTKALLTSMQQKRFKIGEYHDLYAERLQALVEAKAQGKELVAPPDSAEAPAVINLMDALRKSLKQTDTAPPRAVKAAPSKRTKATARAATRKQKSA
ncbi:MAG TPA: Ku protein [Planctomycetaceae bacterium]|nr:Ku protein [Planctomycetaceae bacterium]